MDGSCFGVGPVRAAGNTVIRCLHRFALGPPSQPCPLMLWTSRWQSLVKGLLCFWLADGSMFRNLTRARPATKTYVSFARTVCDRTFFHLYLLMPMIWPCIAEAPRLCYSFAKAFCCRIQMWGSRPCNDSVLRAAALLCFACCM